MITQFLLLLGDRDRLVLEGLLRFDATTVLLLLGLDPPHFEAAVAGAA